MALRVKCKCGKILNVSSKLADKRITCPGCQRPFTIPIAKFQAAVKPGHPAAKPSTSSAAAQPPPIIQTAHAPALKMVPQPIPEPVIADLSGTIGLSSSGAFGEIQLEGPPAAVHASAPPAVDVGDPVELSYARDNVAPAPIIGGRVSAAIEGPKRTYWSDALGSLLYPFRSGGNAANFLVIGFLCLSSYGLQFVGIFGFIGSLIIFGWVRAMYLSVVQETASGTDDMPGIKMEDGFLEDIIKPAFKYIGSYAVALLPAAAYLIGMASGMVPDSMQSGIALMAWIAVGIFIWPIILMLFAFSALDMIYRVDLIFATIFRTWLPYLSLWVMLLLVGFLSMLPWLGDALTAMNLGIALPSTPKLGLTGDLIFVILDVYFSIITMRLIGLYYLHFNRRFAIVME